MSNYCFFCDELQVLESAHTKIVLAVAKNIFKRNTFGSLLIRQPKSSLQKKNSHCSLGLVYLKWKFKKCNVSDKKKKGKVVLKKNFEERHEFVSASWIVGSPKAAFDGVHINQFWHLIFTSKICYIFHFIFLVALLHTHSHLHQEQSWWISILILRWCMYTTCSKNFVPIFVSQAYSVCTAYSVVQMSDSVEGGRRRAWK